MLILYLFAFIVLAAAALKTYATKPRVLDLRDLSQTKATPKEALALTRNVLGRDSPEKL